MNEQQCERLLELLGSIAGSLAALAEQAAAGEHPHYKRPLAAYPAFDWEAIGAAVIATDEYGATQVEWRGELYTRRSPTGNKFGPAIWFSRPDGKDAAGNARYVRLVTFRDLAEPEPLGRAVEAAVAQSRPAAPRATNGATRPPASAAATPADADALFDELPSAGAARDAAAEAVRAKVRGMAAGYARTLGEGPASQEELKYAASALMTLCRTDERRRAAVRYLVDAESLTELGAAAARALRDWVGVRKGADGEWVPSQVAIADLRAIAAVAGFAA